MIRVRALTDRDIFHPRVWFLGYFALFFLVPAFVAVAITGYIKGYGPIASETGRHAFYGALGLCLIFAAAAWAASYAIPDRPTPGPTGAPLSPVTRAQAQTGWLMFAFGALPTALLGAAFTGDTRSRLVAGLEGQILFALSFALILGYIAVAISALERRRLVALCLVTLTFVALMAVLGGRGRVVWPIVSVFASWRMIRSRRLLLAPVLAFVLLVFVLSALMDPLVAIYYGAPVDVAVRLADFNALLAEVFVERRNFDGFHNFFLIHHHDSIPRSIDYLIEGPRQAFMAEFFPSVLARGVGFPATVPGTFWMAGGAIGLLTGAALYGLVLGVLSRLYLASRNALWLGFQFYFFTWILNSGASLFDNLGKILAVIVLMAPFWVLPRIARDVQLREGCGP